MKNPPVPRPLAAALADIGSRRRAIEKFRRTPRRSAQQDPARPRTAWLPLGAMLTGVAFAPLPVLAEDAAGTKARPTGEAVLPTVQVEDSAVPEATGYQGGPTRVGKIRQLAKDIPQSVTIVPEKLITERGSDTLKDALRNVAGLTFNAAEGGRIGDNITLRGYSAVSDLYLDGMRDVAQYNRDTFNYEQIDVLRGSASMVFGRGSTGGVINQVSKVPLLEDRTRLSMTLGSFDYKRVTADLNKKLGDEAGLRINAMLTDGDTFRDYAHTDRKGIAPSVRWGVGTQNEFILSLYHLEYNDLPDYGIPIENKTGGRPIDVPVRRFYGIASTNYQKDSATIATGGWTHRFDADTELKTVVRRGDFRRDLRAVAPSTGAAQNITDSTVVNRGRQARGADESTVTLQSDLTTRLDLLGMKHFILAGTEYVKEYADRWSYANANTTPSASGDPATTVGDPNPYPILPANYSNSYFRVNPQNFHATTLGLYGQDIIELTRRWKLVVGARWDHFDADYTQTSSNTATLGQVGSFQRRDRVWSYRSGLMFQPTDAATYYVSYGTSFNPSADLYSLDARSQNTPPEKNRNIETGAKWELFDGNLSARTAIFRTEKTNERNTDLAVPDIVLLSGKRHTDGIELEAAGRITRDWEVFAAVAFMKAEIDEHLNPNAIGLRPPNTPPYTGTLWTTYNLGNGWKVGGGADFVGTRLGYAVPNNNVSAPVVRQIDSYVRVDAMLSYDQPRYAVRLNLFNLFDTRYFEAIYPNGPFAYPGTTRAAQVTLTLKF